MTKMGTSSSRNLSDNISPPSPPVIAREDRYSTPPSTLKRSNRSLLAQHLDPPTETQMLVLGMPRACDIAPETRSTTTASTSNLNSNARYYNVNTTSRRRHSIGAYFMRSSNSHDDLHHFQDHTSAIPMIVEKSATRGAMEDIIIISCQKSQAAELWVIYLKACFEQIRKNKHKPPYRILNIGVEDLSDTVSPVFENKLRTARLELIIICPVLLDYILQHPQRTRKLAALLRQDCVLAMLLGVDESMLTDRHKAALVSFPQWRKMESVKDRDEKFVGDFLGEAVAILARNTSTVQNPGKCPFVLAPKKVNKSQKKVVIILQEPLDGDDNFCVSLVKNNEDFNVAGVKKRNPYTLAFRMPDEYLHSTCLIGVRVYKNHHLLGCKQIKCEGQLTALEQILRHFDEPMDFTCQALNILPTDKEKLDEFFVKAYQKNVPPNFSLIQGPGLMQHQRSTTSQEEYPTLLHFAAHFGLEQLCWALIETPGGDLACEIRNGNDLTPSEMAEKAGHFRLSGQLAGYMQMTQFTSAYSFLKGMIDGSNKEDGNNNSHNQHIAEDYLNPRPVNETYQIPPSPRPCQESGYMPMKPSNCVWNIRKNSLESSLSSKSSKANDIEDELIEIINDFKNNVFSINEVEALVEQWRSRNYVKQSFKDKQKQLNELREEYERVQLKMKEEMKEVGRPSPLERIRNFFKGSSNKSPSSSISNKDKEKGLRRKRKKGNNASLVVTANQQDCSSIRPASSLSIVSSSSSSSSGRLSTESGTSFGDPSAIADAWDRRLNVINFESYQQSDKSKPNETNTKYKISNYDVPPTAIPVPPSNLGQHYCNLPPTNRLLNTVDESETDVDKTDSGLNYVNLGTDSETNNLPEYVNVEVNTLELAC